MRTGRRGCAVAQSGSCPSISDLDQRLRTHAVDSVEQRIQRAELECCVKSCVDCVDVAGHQRSEGAGVKTLSVVWIELDRTIEPTLGDLRLIGKPIRTAHRVMGKRINRIQFHATLGMTSGRSGRLLVIRPEMKKCVDESSERQASMRACKSWVEFDRALEMPFRDLICVGREPVKLGQPEVKGLPCIQPV